MTFANDKRSSRALPGISATLLRCSVLAMAAALAPAVYAQDTQDPQDAEDPQAAQDTQTANEGETGDNVIVVSGIRASLNNALQTKRASNEIVDSISAEDAGKFPDQNVAESLQRVSGIQIQRGSEDAAGSSSGDGEGSKVSVRGLRPDLAKVLLNGSAIASSTGGREFDFSNLPSELIAAVNVYKSSSASQEEGGIGGTINILTRSPLDTGRFMAVGMARGTYHELADNLNYRLSGLVNTVFGVDENFGVLLGATYTNDSLRRDSIESFGWDFAPAPYDGLIARDYRANLKLEDREKLSLNGTVEWEPVPDLNLRLDGLYTQQIQNENASNYQLRVGQNSIVNTAEFNDNGTGVYIVTTPRNAAQNWHRVVLFDRRDTDRIKNVVGKFEWTPGEWEVGGRLGYTNATYKRDPSLFTVFAASARLSYDLRDGDRWPVLGSAATDPYDADPGVFRLVNVNRAINASLDSETFAHLDLTRFVEFGPFSAVRVGAKIGDRRIDFDQLGVNVPAGQLTGLTLADFVTDFPVDNFIGTDDSPNLVRSWPYPDSAAVLKMFPFETALSDVQVRAADATQNYSIDERVLAGYAQLDIDHGPFRGNVGIRLIDTRQGNQGFLVNGANVEPQTLSRSYFNALPSLNLNWEVAPDLLVRLSAAKTLTRPTFRELSNAASVNISAGTASIGNPDLEPYKSNNFDTAIEWYFARGALLSVGAFYKDVESFITNSQAYEVLPGLGDDPYLVSRPVNGSAEVLGFEVSYQQNFTFLPSPLDGLGVIANYTFVDSSSNFSRFSPDADDGALPGTSKHSGNVVVYYERDRFSTRLAYNRRSSFVLFPLSLGGQNVSRRAYGQLDATASYDVTDNVSLVLQANNLTHSTTYDYAGIEERWVAYRDTGRTFSIEGRVKF